MTSFNRATNTCLLFITICILGGVSGVYLHKNNIRLMPHIDNALSAPVKIWAGTKQQASNLIDFSSHAFSSMATSPPQFKGLELDNVKTETRDNHAWPNIENITIERRIRYMRSVENIDVATIFDAIHHKWERFSTNTGLIADYIINSTWNTLASWYKTVNSVLQSIFEIPGQIHDYSFTKASAAAQTINDYVSKAYSFTKETTSNIAGKIGQAISYTTDKITGSAKYAYSKTTGGINSFYNGVKNAVLAYHTASISGMDKALNKLINLPHSLSSALIKPQDFEFQNILSYEPAAGEETPIKTAEASDPETMDSSGYTIASEEKMEEPEYRYAVEEKTLNVEGVLVPQNATVISSSRDGQISKINFENGDMFQKGDILIEYDCGDLKAELEAAEAEKELTGKRSMRNNKLFKLDIISDIEDLGFKTEDIKASAQAKIVEHRMEQCYIRAAYDGRVTNKLANEHEFTRTDRVLMEVASLDDLEIEFLVPSIWLRWVNVDAPITITVNETDENYDAVIKRIYGEIDPVSQSIQMSAKLEPYESPLLPGMSGTVTLDVALIREAGIKGFLEQPRYAGSGAPAE